MQFSSFSIQAHPDCTCVWVPPSTYLHTITFSLQTSPAILLFYQKHIFNQRTELTGYFCFFLIILCKAEKWLCGKSLKFKTSFVPHSDAQISAGSLNALGFCHVVGYLEIYVNEQINGMPSKVTSVYISKDKPKIFEKF